MSNKDISIQIGIVDIDSSLTDLRVGKENIVVGTISGLVKQYGIKMIKNKKNIVFSAPHKRMQLFAEKLHFSGIDFEEI